MNIRYHEHCVGRLKPFGNGIVTGFFLQLAVGPVFFFILGITITTNYLNSLSAILAVTVVDFVYITLSIFGVSRFLEAGRTKRIFGMISSIVLIVFGALTVRNGLHLSSAGLSVNAAAWNPLTTFMYCFLLTISSPVTIVYWGSIFTAKAIEMDYQRNDLIIFGVGAGMSTILFLAPVMLLMSLLKGSITLIVIQVTNILVGCVIIFYGIVRLVKSWYKSRI